jgi:carboxymethylenebutenolidase
MSTTDVIRAGKDLKITAADGHVFDAYLARPAGRARGGLVVAQDAFGLSDYIRSVCDSYAADGYVAVAPAVYDRQERNAVFGRSPEDHERSRTLRNNLAWDKVILDITACRDQVSDAGAVGIVGFCLGGSIVWLAAATIPFAAASSYYGKDVPDWLDKTPKCPIILHFGERDHLIPMSGVERVRAAYPDLPVYVYPAGHGFDGITKNHDDTCAALARERTLALFRKHIG